MNRIYKVIWSKVKHQYVVVSEFAHSCTKSTGSRVGRSAAAVLAALVLTMGAGSVQAATSDIDVSFAQDGQETPITGTLTVDSADVSKLNVEGGGGHVTTLGGLVDQSAANANNINDIKNSLYGTNDQPGLTEQMKDLKDYADRIQGLANGAAAGVRENREDISELKSNNNLQDESIKFLEEKDTQQDASIDAINQKNDSQDASIDAINQKNDSQDASIDAINQKNDSQDASIDAINQKNDSQDASIDAINQKNDSQDVSIDAINQKNDSQDASIDAINQKNDSQDASIDAINQKNDSQDASIDAINQKNDSQDASIDAINQKNDSQDASIDAINQKNDSQDASIDAINQKNDSQDASIDAINQKNDSQDASIDAINQKNDSQDASIDAINQKNDSQDASIDAINQKNDSQDASIDAINQKNDQQDTQINTINKQIGANPDGSLGLTNGEKTLVKGINANSAAIAQNRQDINNLNHRVDSLDSRIDKVGAGAAALAALHPLDFDPDAKWDFAAGYGNYNGENAVAVGTFYRPNEDTMFSVGGTFGNGENMINAGVSLKIGAGSSHVTTSRTAMAKEIKSMRDIVAKQDAQIQKLTAMVNALVGVQTETDTTTMFPDVPENHWAYEAVEAMAKSGLVKGYPDGEFKGDRTMTRYEFAQIVYNAIQAGAEVDARLVEEFKPELEYFHIATVAKDKDGNPTIERVRAN